MADAKAENKSMGGVEKAAVILLSLGEDIASEVMKHLGPVEVQKIGSHMAKIEGLSPNELDVIAKEFEEEMHSSISSGGSEYVKNVIMKALGPDKANAIINRIIEGGEGSGLEALKWMEPKVVADLIRDEHPQTIAVILSYLEPEHASQVMLNLPIKIRSDVIMRVATMESVSPDALRELENAIMHRISGSVSIHTKSIGGVKIAAEILNQMDSSNENAIISDIEKSNTDLAGRIQEQMFVFADIINIDDRGIQTMLKEVSSDVVALALRVADDTLKEKFFRNMSERAAEMLKEDMETRGPVKLSEVEKSQQEIVRTARKLAQEGKIVIGGKGGEEQLV